MSNMIIGSVVRTTIECQCPLREAGRMYHDDPTTGIHMVTSEGIQSTPGNLDLTQDQFWYKVWSTGIELTEKDKTKIDQLAIECMYQGLSVSAVQSEP